MQPHPPVAPPRTELLVHHPQLEIGEAVARVEVDGALEGGEGQLVLPLRRERPAQILCVRGGGGGGVWVLVLCLD